MFRVVYNCSLVSLVVALLCFNFEWLQMRINTGWIFFGSWFLGSFLVGWLVQRGKIRLSRGVTLGNFFLCLAISWLVLGRNSLPVVPAALIREGLQQTTLSFRLINVGLISWLLGGLGLSLIQRNV